jgi:hypothetical protein
MYVLGTRILHWKKGLFIERIGERDLSSKDFPFYYRVTTLLLILNVYNAQ